MSKKFKYKWWWGSVEITANNELMSKSGSRIYWTIPISSIKTIADADFSFTEGTLKNGFVIQANDKLYAIHHKLKNNEEFINALKSVNPKIIYERMGILSAPDLWKKYYEQSKVFWAIIIIFICGIAFVFVNAAIQASKDGLLKLP